MGDPTADADELARALRAARPAWAQDGFGVRGPQPVVEVNPTAEVQRRTDAPKGSVERPSRSQPVSTTVVEDTTPAAATAPKINFIFSDATITVFNVITYRIKVADGKINGVLPTGMGFGNYTLTLATPDDSLIYAGATFNPTTLAITSRFLGVSTATGFPESRIESDSFGVVYWLLGYTYLVGDLFRFYNSRVGDINFEFVYGSMNGVPALLPVDTGPGFLGLP